MSLFRKLFGSGGSAPTAPAGPAAQIEHEGFTIRAEPHKGEGGQFQVAGTILKVVDGEERRHGFMRADRLSSLEDAAAMSLQKGRQIVDEQGERMFSRPPARPA